MTKILTDTPNIIVIPPVAFALSLAFGYGMNILIPVTALPTDHSILYWSGIILLTIGSGLGFLGLRRFYRLKVDPHPNTGASDLVTSGLYTISRNPMYLGLLVILLGIGLVSGNIWFLIAWPGLWLHLRYHVIAREEAYLTHKFGEDYLNYMRNVRRWI